MLPAKSEPIETLLTVEDLCALMRVSKATVYNWVQLRKIPHMRVGGLLRFDAGAIRSWLGRQSRGVVTRGKE